MTAAPTPAPDTGLLSPVRAGTPAEAATDDASWLRAMLDAEAALVRAQARLGTVPATAAVAITEAASDPGLNLRELALTARESANPIVGLVQAFTQTVRAHSPEAAAYVHRGSTSQDIFDTAAMLVAARTLHLIRTDLARTTAALGLLAHEHRNTVMAGRTLTMHAVPTTFGLKAAGWRQSLLDADERLNALLTQGLPVSLGGAAGTLAGYLEHAEPPADSAEKSPGAGPGNTYAAALRDAFAQETGLNTTPLPWHALRTPLADLAAALTSTAGALGKIAADVQVLARTEVAEVTEPTAAGRGRSSAMPHKRNPVLATMIRSASLQVPALTSIVTQCMVAEDERSAGAWHAEWQPLRECLRLTGGAAHTAAELLEGLVIHPQRMRRNLDITGGQMLSERLAAAMTPILGRSEARDAVTDASQRADRTGRPLHEALADDPSIQEAVPAKQLVLLCEPTDYTGAAGSLVDAVLHADGSRAANTTG